jgi:predicted metal-dependent phosphoesterase TrpH
VGRADLHVHTTFSDGTCSPYQILVRAQKVGLTTISITDHDNVGALDEAFRIGRQLGVEVVPGVELSASAGEEEIHILGYWFDHTNRQLCDFLAFSRAERRRRAERIIGKLNEMNIPLTLQAVLERAGDASVGRPHIAHALLDEGMIGTYNEAFFKYIGNGKPAYEKKFRLSPKEAIELISSAGGVSFVAHPGTTIGEQTLLDVIRTGIDGIEVVHPSHSPERVAHYSGIVDEYFLLASGGSDFHGGRRNDDEAFGKYYIPDEDVELMRRRCM